MFAKDLETCKPVEIKHQGNNEPMLRTIDFISPCQNKKSIPLNTAKPTRENELLRTQTITITLNFTCDTSLHREVRVCFSCRAAKFHTALFLCLLNRKK